LSAESDQRFALRRRIMERVNTSSTPAYVRVRSLTQWMTPVVQRVPALCSLLLALGIIHLAWSGDLHRGASDFRAALHENLMSVYASLPTTRPEYTAPISTTAGLAVSPWPILSSPEALATTQVPANSTTVALGNVTVFESPPK
jgi:hypothetical protein